jgi:hypothetical protein
MDKPEPSDLCRDSRPTQSLAAIRRLSSTGTSAKAAARGIQRARRADRGRNREGARH